MLSHARGRAPEQVHGAGSPTAKRNPDAQPHKGFSLSARARCRFSPPPQETGLLSHSRRGVRAPGATATPESPRVPRGGLPSPLYAVFGRPEPTSHVGAEAREPARDFGLDRGKAPHPKKTEESETDLRSRGCLCSATRGAQPQGTCTVPGLPPSLRTLFFFGVCSWFPSVAPCPAPGAGLCLWSGSTPPGVRLCACLLPLFRGGVLPRLRPRAGRGFTLPVRWGLRGSGRPETA